MQTQVATAEKQITCWRHERDETTTELELAQRQLADLQANASAIAAVSGTTRELEIKSWLARLKQLKQAFVEYPQKSIPELQLLSDRDWLRLARTARFDSDEHARKTLAAVRAEAKREFTRRMAAALSKFTKAANGQLPATTLELAPHFDPPAELSMLQRYEMTQTGKAGEGKSGVSQAIREKGPMDADYDERMSVQANGGWGTDIAPRAWMDDFKERHIRANKDYAQANYGAMARGLESLAPYFNPPLDTVTLEKLLKAERESSY
jgi:hypothetical protein